MYQLSDLYTGHPVFTRESYFIVTSFLVFACCYTYIHLCWGLFCDEREEGDMGNDATLYFPPVFVHLLKKKKN